MYKKNIVSTVSIKKIYPHERRHTDGDGGGVGGGGGGGGRRRRVVTPPPFAQHIGL